MIRLCHIKFGILVKLSPLLHELDRCDDSPFAHHVVVPSYNNDSLYLTRRFPNVHFHFIDLFTRKLTGNNNPLLKLLRYLEYVVKAANKAKKIAANIYVAHDVTAMYPASRAARKRHVPLIYRAHELYSEAGKRISPLPGLWNKVEQYYVRNTEYIIVPEPHRAQIYRDEYGARQLPAVVRNVPPVTKSYEKTSYLRDSLGLNHTVRICLYQGLLTPSRCVAELVEALGYTSTDFHLVLVGDILDEFKQQLQQVIGQHGLDQRIHFLGFMSADKLSTVTASADLGILLYRNDSRNNYYAAPNKLYEYLFAGLPVVTSNFPGLTAIVEQHGVGASANPDNPEEIASAIQEAANVRGGQQLAERMRATYKWENEIALLQQIYMAALEH